MTPSSRSIDWTSLADGALARTDRPGAIVVLDVETRAVLASVERAGSSLHPATTPVHPGSVVKPLLALAALHEGLVSPEETIACAGPRELEGQRLSCFHDHGDQDLDASLRTSCNHYAFELAARLGEERIEAHFERFGLSTRGPRGHVAELGTGHAQLAVSPLELAEAYAALARPSQSLPYTPEQLEPVYAGMRSVVEHEEGTGRTAAVEGVKIAGKTGTADVELDGQRVRYNWFGAYFPADDPQVVIVVQLEGEGSGGEVAGPVIQELVRASALDRA